MRMHTNRPPSFRLPSPQSLTLAMVALAAVACVLRVGLPIYLRESALRKVEALGGKLSANDDYPPPPSEFGDSWFDGVISVVQLSDSRITDRDMVHLKCLTRLQMLLLARTPISDAGLPNLQGLTDLRLLSLDGTQVTDAGLSHLQGLINLQLLSLDGTQVTDAGLANLSGLQNLTTLCLRETKITDAGLTHLKSMTQLEQLLLSSSQVTDEAPVHFFSTRYPRAADPDRPRITDAGIANLKRSLPTLQIDVYR